MKIFTISFILIFSALLAIAALYCKVNALAFDLIYFGPIAFLVSVIGSFISAVSLPSAEMFQSELSKEEIWGYKTALSCLALAIVGIFSAVYFSELIGKVLAAAESPLVL